MGTAVVEDAPDGDGTGLDDRNVAKSHVGTDSIPSVHIMYHSWSSGHCPLTLPTPSMPPPEEYEPVEKFIAGVVESLYAPIGPVGSSLSFRRSQEKRAIYTMLRTREDPQMLNKILLALRTAGHGHVLRLLASDSKNADSRTLLQLVFAVDPFIPPDALVQLIVKDFQEKSVASVASQKQSKSPPPPAIIDPKVLEQDARLQPFLSYQIADAHLHLLVALVSANGVYATPVVSALWRLATQGLSDSPMERITRLHAALSTTMRLCPKAQAELFPVMASNFPFKLLPSPQQLWYAHQCLAVVKYMPQIHKNVIELLIDRCLEIDVEIKIEEGGDVKIEELEDKEADAFVDEADIFGIDVGTSKDQAKSDKQTDLVGSGEKTVDDMADKLDMLLLVLFEHVAIASKAQGSGEFTQTLFNMVMPVFDSTIITTHRSKYVQFVLFMLCGLDYESNKGKATAVDDHSLLYRVFTGKLLEILLDPLRATTMRQSSACYLASFLSRSTYVCIDTVCETLAALLSWAEAYMLTFPTEASTIATFRGKDAQNQCEAHCLFYTVCQAAFYIICFRGGDAVKFYRTTVAKKHIDNDDAKDLGGMNIGSERWSRLCAHHLNPLRYCLESVRGEFLHVAGLLSLLKPALLQSLSEEDKEMSTGARRPKNAKPRRSIMTPALLAKKRLKEGVGGLGRGSNPLNSFFPFDPYLLRRSNIFIEGYYRHWGGSLEVIADEKILVANNDDYDGGYESGDSSVSSNSSTSSGSGNERQTTSGEQAMSLASAASGMAVSINQRTEHECERERKKQQADSQPPDADATTVATSKKTEQREAWANTLDRKRAQSIGSGSW